MILDEGLKNLIVTRKGGGSLIGHRPVFSSDSMYVFIVVSSTVYVYSTASGLCTGKIQTPSVSTIVNIKSLSEPKNLLVLLTVNGEFAEVDFTTFKITSLRKIDLNPVNWIPISHFMDFIWPSTKFTDVERFFVLGYPTDTTKPVLYSVAISNLYIERICRKIDPHGHSVACSQNGKFVAALQDDCLFVKDFDTRVRWHKSGTRKFTCVAVHPYDFVCATGDDSGRVVLWTSVIECLSPAKTVFHWHTLPVADLSFSIDGTMLFSGGGECTLVKWDLKNTENKRTLPRMGLPIRHIGVSPSNTFIAVSHADNCIHLVNPQNQIVQTIQNITQCYVPESDDDINTSETSLGGSLVYQAGLHIDPNRQSLVMNGKPGRLQCYSFREDKHIYDLDITQQNYITAERRKAIPNVDVTKVAFSKNGVWLATGESRSDNSKVTELRLKFWKFDSAKQKFVLNTSVEWPHEKDMHSLKIQPVNEDDINLITATCGDDNKFKTWGIVHNESIHGKSEWWNCENAGSYRDLPGGPLSFSSDGSLIAAAFGRILTLWSTAVHKLSLVLSHTKLQQNIRMVEFGANANSHLVLCSSADYLIVWDIISSSLMWVAPFQAECIAVDPFSNLAAAFSSKRHLYFFRLDKSEPIAIQKSVSSCTVVSSVFVSNPSQFEINGLKSTLMFINSEHELSTLLSLEEQEEIEVALQAKLKEESSLPSPDRMTAERVVKEKNKNKLKQYPVTGGLPGYPILRQIMDASPHTMPSVTYYATQLLQALNVRRKPMEKIRDIERALKAIHLDTKETLSKTFSNEMQVANECERTEVEILPVVSTTEKHVKPFNINLDNVASEDTTWINQIYLQS